MMGHMGTHGAAPALYQGLKYDPTALEAIGMAASTPILIVAKKNFPAKDLKEFVAYVKANAAKVNQAHTPGRAPFPRSPARCSTRSSASILPPCPIRARAPR
jgi:tripartite-type tricarboxylate transporter receptor subunit TctC